MQRDTNKQKNMAAASGNEPRAQLLRTDRPMEDSVANENRRKTRAFLRYALSPSVWAPPQDLNEKDWKRLCRFGKEYGVFGVVFDGMSRIFKEQGSLPESVVESGISAAMAIEKKNKLVNRAVVRLVNQLENDGFRCCLLKGQGNNLMYPNVYGRIPGDIDMWVLGKEGTEPDVRTIVRYVRQFNPKGKILYHHVDYGDFDSVGVEIHYRPSYMVNPVYERRLQRWFAAKAEAQLSHRVELPGNVGQVAVPTPEFNAVFQLAHIFRHLLREGFGLRQVIDYYYVLMTMTEREEVRSDLRYLGLEKIAGGMMWLLQTSFGLEEQKMIAKPDERIGNMLMKEVLKSGQPVKRSASQQTNAKHFWQTKLGMNIRHLGRDLRMVRYFPSECLFEPLFRLYHFFWRVLVRIGL